MSAPKKKASAKSAPLEPQVQDGKLHISVSVPSLSSVDISNMPESAQILKEVRDSVYHSIHNAELQDSLDKWNKENNTQNNIQQRDLAILKKYRI